MQDEYLNEVETLDRPWQDEFPNEDSFEMDDRAVQILLNNMREAQRMSVYDNFGVYDPKKYRDGALREAAEALEVLRKLPDSLPLEVFEKLFDSAFQLNMVVKDVQRRLEDGEL